MKRYFLVLLVMTGIAVCPGLSTAQCNMPDTPPWKPGSFPLTQESIMACFVEDTIPGFMIFCLDIDKDGTIIDAVAERSSGLRSLDTCIVQRLCELPKFYPATDGEGKPVASTYRLPLVICFRE